MSVKNILDGTIPIEGLLPEKLTATDIKADRTVEGNYLIANESLKSSRYVIAGYGSEEFTRIDKGHIEAYDLHVENVEARVEVMTPLITLGETIVLTPTETDNFQSIAVTYSDGATGTLTVAVHSKMCNFNKICMRFLVSLS